MAGLIGSQTRLEFERFIINRYRTTVVPLLANYYQTNGSWIGADEVLAWADREGVASGPGPLSRRFAILTLTDSDGNAVYTVPDGPQVRTFTANGRLPIVVNGTTVGWLRFRFAPAPDGSPEDEFSRRSSRLILLGLLLATVMALILGLILARTLTRPIRALTTATRAMAHGALGTQVDIRTGDELGELGSSFNQMSTDLARSSQVRRQMTADIAHDLRTPLSVILGYTEAL